MDPNAAPTLRLDLDHEDALLEPQMPHYEEELAAHDSEELERYDEQILAGLVSP
jgi:hypothetical protein